LLPLTPIIHPIWCVCVFVNACSFDIYFVMIQHPSCVFMHTLCLISNETV
jgi:hypothetical protein